MQITCGSVYIAHMYHLSILEVQNITDTLLMHHNCRKCIMKFYLLCCQFIKLKFIISSSLIISDVILNKMYQLDILLLCYNSIYFNLITEHKYMFLVCTLRLRLENFILYYYFKIKIFIIYVCVHLKNVHVHCTL